MIEVDVSAVVRSLLATRFGLVTMRLLKAGNGGLLSIDQAAKIRQGGTSTYGE
jgi:hypothetical protein